MLAATLEAILFVASKPLSPKRLAKATDTTEEEVGEALAILKTRYNHDASGIQLIQTDGAVQFATHTDAEDAVDGFIKKDLQGELTRAQLETLTVVAYRGPVTRPEIEQIRGVNCSVILRNLLVRGLVQENTHKDELLPKYSLSVAALAHLGVSSAEELPDYLALSNHEHLDAALSETEDA